jgi:hypothetical protein
MKDEASGVDKDAERHREPDDDNLGRPTSGGRTSEPCALWRILS